MKDLQRSVKRAVESAQEYAREGDAHNINIARRSNVVVVRNVGGPGSVERASAKQTTHIRQDGTETHEQTETTSTFGGARKE